MRWLWVAIYRGIARAGATYLTWGEKDAATYLRAGVGIGDLLPGISDVDIAVVLAEDPAALGAASERVRERWQRLYRALPGTRLLLDLPRVYDDADLRDLVGASALTYGLDDSGEATADRATYFGDRASEDRIRMSDRPGLYGATADWRILTGPDRRPPEPSRDAQSRRIAAWLELLYWWRWVFAVCVDPTGPRTAALCVRLVSEPARIWLWLASGERAAGRTDALQRAARRMPDEEDALRRALALERSLSRSPDPPLADVLPTMVRLSARIAGLIAAELADTGTTAVRLAGTDSAVLIDAGRSAELADDHLVGGREEGALPLCDWRSLVYPALADESFLPTLGDPGEPTVLADATRAQRAGSYHALRADGLMIFPAPSHEGTKLRAIKCQASDPVSFALAGGAPLALFPAVPGWSAEHTARRAVAEHRAWLMTQEGSEEANDAAGAGGRALGMLLTAARAALFLESVKEGDPELVLTVAEVAGQVAARSSSARGIAEEGFERYRELVLRRTLPPAATISALRKLVLTLPGYAEREFAVSAGRGVST